MSTHCPAIDDYLDRLPAEQRVALEKLRHTIRKCVPAAEECIYYRLPAFRWQGKPLVAFGATKKHCAFYPLSGTIVEAHRELLSRYDVSKGTIRFQSDQPLPVTLVRKLVKARQKEIT